jgi:hypothetical protein
MAQSERRAEVEAWLQRSQKPGFEAELAAGAAAAGWRAAVDLSLALDAEADRSAHEHEARAAREEEVRTAERRARAELSGARAEAAVLTSQLAGIQASRVWRARNRLVRMPGLRRLTRR